MLHISRTAYYKWLHEDYGERLRENKQIATLIETIHKEHPDVLRICRILKIKSTIKYANHGCTRQAPNPQYIAENVLDRNFKAEKPNEKWLTDVTEFKWYEGIDKHKIYLSAILDLYDRRITAFAIRDSNDTKLVYDTFDKAVRANPEAHPIFHSDRGYQYTIRVFHQKLEKAGMTQSRSFTKN